MIQSLLKLCMAGILAGWSFWSAGPVLAAETGAGQRMDDQSVITLYEGLRRVTSEGHVVKIAGQDEAIAREDARIARSGLFPRINASGARTALSTQPATVSTSSTGVVNVVPTAERNYFSYNVNIQQLLFDFNGTLSKYRASRSLYQASQFGTRRVQNGLALDFAIGYFDVLEARKLIESAEREVDRVKSHLHDAESMYAAGVITKNDMLQAQVRLSDAKQRLLTARNLRDVRMSRISNLLLIPLDRKFGVEEYESEIKDPAPLNYDAAWKKALAGRPEVQIADKTIEAVDQEAVSKKSEFLPKFFARAANDYVDNSFISHQDNWSLIVGVNVNLFEGGSSVADLQKTAHRKQRLVEQRATLVDEIKLEVKRYLLDIQNAYERILVNRDSVSQAQENLRINRSRYEAGVGTATEVLDAVTLLTVAETNHIRSVYDYRKSEAAAFYATGENFLDIYK